MTLTDEELETRPPRPASFGAAAWLRWGWRTLTSMRTALILLLLLALAAVPGSVFPQRGVSPEDVAAYAREHPGLAEWLDRLWLFDVFQAPWFAAVYLLLFVSLTGCVVPRLRAHLAELRRRPPDAPRNLSRLPQHASFAGDGTDLAEYARRLRRKGFRVATGPDWVAAEKGYLRETGNLLFHFALLGLLFAVAAGGLYGYRGNVLVVEGDGFANTVAAYDRYLPGPRVSPESLHPFSFTLEDFEATYAVRGERRGQALDYAARLRVADRPGAPERVHELKVNRPLEVGGTQVYLLGHGYAPVFKVIDGEGRVAFDGPVPCLAVDQLTYTSECVIKVPDAVPQLGFLGRFLPTTVKAGEEYVSAFPATLEPTVELYAFTGDLGLGSGRPQSVYVLDTDRLRPLVMKADPLAVGETLELPEGAGSIQFTGVREWVSLQITYDPGRMPALVTAALAVLGVVPSLTVRRRRIWVRIRPAEGDGPGRVEVGGLSRTDSGAGFAEEFTEIVKALRGEGRKE